MSIAIAAMRNLPPVVMSTVLAGIAIPTLLLVPQVPEEAAPVHVLRKLLVAGGSTVLLGTIWKGVRQGHLVGSTYPMPLYTISLVSAGLFIMGLFATIPATVSLAAASSELQYQSR